MSYCRFSSDDFACDLYCYESGAGFVTHVAGNRFVGDIPKSLPVETSSAKEWVAAQTAQHDFLMACGRKPIELPHAGESFCDPDVRSFLERVKGLVALGYRVPDGMIAWIEEEVAAA